MWNKILICLNDASLTETLKPVLQKEIIENTTSTFMFSVAMTIVKKVLVLENQLYKNHFVSGYIFFALIKKYKRFVESGNIEAKDAVLFFSLLKCATICEAYIL